MDGDLALFENQYKRSDSHPDLTGTVSIPFDLLLAAQEDPNCLETRNGVEYIKLRVAVWQPKVYGDNKPVLKGKVSRPQQKKEEPTTKLAFKTEGRAKLS